MLTIKRGQEHVFGSVINHQEDLGEEIVEHAGVLDQILIEFVLELLKTRSFLLFAVDQLAVTADKPIGQTLKLCKVAVRVVEIGETIFEVVCPSRIFTAFFVNGS